jgi:hypothetical protein
MVKVRFQASLWFIVVLAFTIAGTTVAVAQTTVTLINNNKVTFGAVSYTISGCTYVKNGSSSATCGSTNDLQLVAVEHRGVVSLEVEGTGVGSFGSNIFTSSGASGTDTVTLTLTAAGLPHNTAYTVSSAISGTSNLSSYNGDVYAKYVKGTANANVTLAAATNSASFTSSGSGSLAITETIGLTPVAGSTLVLANTTLYFPQVPEPASIAVLSSGIAGLTAIRRRRQKRLLAAGSQG